MTDDGAVLLTAHQNCSASSITVKVQYLLTDGAFRKDIFFDMIPSKTDHEAIKMILLASPSDCDGYLFVPFVDNAPKTGFETDPQDRIVPVSDTGIDGFESSYLTAPDSMGGLTGQGTLGLLASAAVDLIMVVMPGHAGAVHVVTSVPGGDYGSVSVDANFVHTVSCTVNVACRPSKAPHCFSSHRAQPLLLADVRDL